MKSYNWLFRLLTQCCQLRAIRVLPLTESPHLLIGICYVTVRAFSEVAWFASDCASEARQCAWVVETSVVAEWITFEIMLSEPSFVPV